LVATAALGKWRETGLTIKNFEAATEPLRLSVLLFGTADYFPVPVELGETSKGLENSLSSCTVSSTLAYCHCQFLDHRVERRADNDSAGTDFHAATYFMSL
jgi:hypothetical protein